MIGYIAPYVNPKIKSQKAQNPTSVKYVSFLINMTLMVSVTVGLVASFTAVRVIPRFFMERVYLVYIMISVAIIPLLLIALVRKIRSNVYAVPILLWIMVILWSVIFAAVFSPCKWKCALIALAVTITVTAGVVLVAMRLPPLNVKGFILFLSISAVLGVSAAVLSICYHLIPELKMKPIICILLAVPVALFTLLVMFIFVNIRTWIMWWFTSNPMGFILAFFIWCHMISLFAQIYSSLGLCEAGLCNLLK
ncbi:unnamed protein product [Trichobilharzia szidati]|nr:unnamed protein product [Trichobilharzia szidati]